MFISRTRIVCAGSWCDGTSYSDVVAHDGTVRLSLRPIQFVNKVDYI